MTIKTTEQARCRKCRIPNAGKDRCEHCGEPRYERFAVRLHPEEVAMLGRLVQALGTSPQDAMRRLIRAADRGAFTATEVLPSVETESEEVAN